MFITWYCDQGVECQFLYNLDLEQFIEIEKWEELRLRQGVSNNFISCGQLTQILHEHYYWNPFDIVGLVIQLDTI